MTVVHPKDMEVLENRVSETLPKHDEITESDVAILHSVLSASSADELDIPTILVLHGGLRETGHFYEEMSNHMNPVSKYFMNNTKIENRKKVSTWLDKPTVVASNSKFVQNAVQEYYDTETQVIYPPVDTQKFTLNGEEEEGDYFLSVQRLVWYKRPDVQIEAFKELDETLYIVGEGRYDDVISSEVEKYSNIHYLGRVSDDRLLKLYRGATATVQTSMKEDFGYVPREGFACGTPAITGYEGGYKEMYDRGNVGKYFNPDNRIESLRNVVSSFSNDDYNSEELRRVAVRNYSFDTTKAKFEEVVNNARQRY